MSKVQNLYITDKTTIKVIPSTIAKSKKYNEITAKQLDLIFVIMSMVRKEHTDETEYVLTFDEIAKIFCPSNPRLPEIKKEVYDAANKIMNSHFELKKDNMIYKFHWIEKCYIDNDNRTFNFKITKDVKEIYLSFQKTGTYINLKSLLSLSTLLQKKLYILLANKSGFKNNVIIKIDDLKQLLSDSGEEVENKYFIRSLTQALNTISKKTNISATCSVNKDGRSIRSVEFKIINRYKPEVTVRSGKSGIKKIIEENKELKQEIKNVEQQRDNAIDDAVTRNEAFNEVNEKNKKLEEEISELKNMLNK